MNKTVMQVVFMMSVMTAAHGSNFYGQGLCEYPQYTCHRASNDSWDRLFPDPIERDLVQRINRTYNALWSGREIAIPKNLSKLSIYDVAPFPVKIEGETEKQIIVDQEKLAWAAYDAQGNLVKWGPISSGRDKCSDSNHSCRTLTGIFRVFSKEDSHCKSAIFPIGKGGAKMPYCMYFHKGFALHGSDDIPGERASHGCVRMFIQDAKWLNKFFVDISSERNNFRGTKVTVRPLNDSGRRM